MPTYQHCVDCGSDVDPMYQSCPNCASLALEEVYISWDDWDDVMIEFGPDSEPCDHEWVPSHEGSDHYTCRFCGAWC